MVVAVAAAALHIGVAVSRASAVTAGRVAATVAAAVRAQRSSSSTRHTTVGAGKVGVMWALGAVLP